MSDHRAEALRARRKMSAEDRASASQLICKRVIKSRFFWSGKTVACYLPMDDEVDTRDIIERAWCANKRIFVPVLRRRGKMSFRELSPKSTLERNSFGVWEPTDGAFMLPRELDIVITPTVVFDEKNNRIGMGGGYFDRSFSFLRHRKCWFQPKLIGVAFECQKVEKITPNSWDIPLYKVFTDIA